MRLGLNAPPTEPAVQAVTYGPVVLSGGYGRRAAMPMPRLNTGRSTLTSERPLHVPGGRGRARPSTLIPIARMQHQHYNVYWLT